MGVCVIRASRRPPRGDDALRCIMLLVGRVCAAPALPSRRRSRLQLSVALLTYTVRNNEEMYAEHFLVLHLLALINANQQLCEV